MSADLAGRVALVTGASLGIGAAIATRLAGEGAAVCLTYNTSRRAAKDVVAAIEADGGRALAIQADSADPDAVAAAVDSTARTFGGLHVLVNNAGYARVGPIEELTLADYDAVNAVNVRAYWVAARAAVSQLGEGGRIINIGSIFADVLPSGGYSIYTTTKAAVAGLTRALGRELAPRGITVNNVQPGSINTPGNPQDSEFADMMRRLIPAGRFGQPRDVADLVAFLAGPAAGYINGASLDIDGALNT